MKIYTKEEILQIAKQIAEKNGGNLTRKMFREQASMLDSAWEKHFGNFGALKEACGITQNALYRKLANQTARHSRHDFLISKSATERLSWGNKYTKPSNSRFETVLVASDFHDIHADDFSVRMFITACKEMQPDLVIINGDIFDLPEFSTHLNDPREYNVSERVKKVHEILARIRKASPKAQIDLIEGNHEARVIRYLLGSAPMILEWLGDIHDMDLRKFFGLDKFDVNYKARVDLRSFTEKSLRREINAGEEIYHEFFLVRHHPPVGGTTVMPGCNGHHHKHVVKSFYHPYFGSFEWHQTGGMHKRFCSYLTENEGRQWNCGFLHAIIDKKAKRVNFDYITVGDTFCQLGGKVYERKAEEYYPSLLAELERFDQKG